MSGPETLKKRRLATMAAEEPAPSELPERNASDTDLVRRVQEGHEDSFRELVRRYQKRAFWLAYNVVNDSEEARDVAQEAFLRVYRSADRFDYRRSFYTWFYRIVVNLAIDHLRKRSVSRRVALEDLGEMESGERRPEARLQDTELGEEIMEVLSGLPEKYRTVIVLRDIEELSCQEIGHIIRCSHATVRWRLHQARKLFREHWARMRRRKGVVEK